MFILCFLLWVIFNGKITLEIAIFGVLISAAMYWFTCKYMGYNIKKDWQLLKCLGLILKYMVTLVWEIIKANFDVVRFILSSKYELEPKLVTFHTDLKSDMCKVLLANSITLTPGTITVSLEENEYCVHCLDADFSNGLKDSSFVSLLHRIEARIFSSKQKTAKTSR